jgi:hypothetical protein
VDRHDSFARCVTEQRADNMIQSWTIDARSTTCAQLAERCSDEAGHHRSRLSARALHVKAAPRMIEANKA